MARPTDYSPKMLKAAREYAETVKESALKGDIQNTALPKIAELALILGVSRSTIYLWADEHKEFSDTLDDISAAQEIKLLDNGLNGTYNPTIAKMVLSSNHNYREKQATELSGPDGGPVQIQDVEITFRKAGA